MFRYYSELVRTPAASDRLRAADKLHQCELCDEGWQSETEVHIHKRLEHADIINTMLANRKEHPVCMICVTPQTDQETFLKHIKTDHLFSSESARRVEREIFICDLCSQVFFNKQMLVVHLAKVHNNVHRDSHIRCPKCNKNTHRKCMWAHFQFHQVQSVASCPICLTKCKDRADLKKHVTSDHQSHFLCNMCMFQTKKSSVFRLHVDSHTNTIAKKNKLDKFKIKLKTYFMPREKHPWWRCNKINAFKGLCLPDKVNICVLCREICTDEKEMRQHIWNHNVPEMEKKCKHVCSCGEEFFNNVLLKHHIFKLKGDHRVLDENDTPLESTGDVQEGYYIELTGRVEHHGREEEVEYSQTEEIPEDDGVPQ